MGFTKGRVLIRLSVLDRTTGSLVSERGGRRLVSILKHQQKLPRKDNRLKFVRMKHQKKSATYRGYSFFFF